MREPKPAISTLSKSAWQVIQPDRVRLTRRSVPNRRLLMDRFHSAQAISMRSNHYGAILFIDMDRFKTVNDVLGHDFGDLLLVEVAKRIRATVRDGDTVARWGGDEFVVLLTEIDKHIDAASQKVALIAAKEYRQLQASTKRNASSSSRLASSINITSQKAEATLFSVTLTGRRAAKPDQTRVKCGERGCSSMVERKLPKLQTRVRSPLPAPWFI